VAQTRAKDTTCVPPRLDGISRLGILIMRLNASPASSCKRTNAVCVESPAITVVAGILDRLIFARPLPALRSRWRDIRNAIVGGAGVGPIEAKDAGNERAVGVRKGQLVGVGHGRCPYGRGSSDHSNKVCPHRFTFLSLTPGPSLFSATKITPASPFLFPLQLLSQYFADGPRAGKRPPLLSNELVDRGQERRFNAKMDRDGASRRPAPASFSGTRY
jgi:hypothetical protein